MRHINCMPSGKIAILGVLSLLMILSIAHASVPQKSIRSSAVPIPLLPESIMDLLIQEVSGELPLNTIRLLAPFEHLRSPEEYLNIFHESRCIIQKLKDYGIENFGVESVPVVTGVKEIGNAESAELWMMEPERKKLMDLEDVPACLASQSQTCDVTAELVYVGSGNDERSYEGKDVRDKIVLASGRSYEVYDLAVNKKGAKGIVIFSAANSDYDPDEVGRDEIVPDYDPSVPGSRKPTFGFVISKRMGDRMAGMLTDGKKVVLRAACKTNTYPNRNEVVWALIKGTELPEEELVFTAHLFEGFAYQGANDNMSGSASILETVRVIDKLIKEGRIPRPKRSIRFLWVDEGVGTVGYLKKYPELARRIFANINQDMVGEGLIMHRAGFQMASTPYSRPSYLNDVLANFIEYVGETNRDNIIHRPVKFLKPILSPTGSNDPFYYHIDRYSGGSDHTIFLDAGNGIPAVGLSVWPDMWYHTNLDRPDKSDSTQLKRVGVITAAAALYLTGASDKEASQMTGEILSRGKSRIGNEEMRAYALISKSEPRGLVEAYKEAENIVRQSYGREETALKSAGFFARNGDLFADHMKEICGNLSKEGQLALDNLRRLYKIAAKSVGVRDVQPEVTPEERRLDRIVPTRTKEMAGYFNSRGFRELIKGKNIPEYDLKKDEQFEIRNFIDGRRSILEIRNAVSAEFRPIPLIDIENYIKTLAIGGMVVIEKKLSDRPKARVLNLRPSAFEPFRRSRRASVQALFYRLDRISRHPGGGER